MNEDDQNGDNEDEDEEEAKKEEGKQADIETDVETIEQATLGALATLENADEEYTDSIMEIVKGKIGGGHHIGREERRRSSNYSSNLMSYKRRASRRPSSGLTLSGGSAGLRTGEEESLLTVSSSHQETLKLHKEVIEQAKYQLWPLDKKLRVIQTAKDYVKRHETELQEKFAQSRTIATILQQVQHLFYRLLQVSRVGSGNKR